MSDSRRLKGRPGRRQSVGGPRAKSAKSKPGTTTQLTRAGLGIAGPRALPVARRNEHLRMLPAGDVRTQDMRCRAYPFAPDLQQQWTAAVVEPQLGAAHGMPRRLLPRHEDEQDGRRRRCAGRCSPAAAPTRRSSDRCARSRGSSRPRGGAPCRAVEPSRGVRSCSVLGRSCDQPRDKSLACRPVRCVEQLVEAMRAYRGAVIVVSHDDDFLGRLELTRTLSMRLPGVLVECGLGSGDGTPATGLVRRVVRGAAVRQRMAALAHHVGAGRRAGQRDRRHHRQPRAAAAVRRRPADRPAVLGADRDRRDGRPQPVSAAGRRRRHW